MAEPTPRYTIYLLTVWAGEGENANDPSSWRFRLENPRTKAAKGYVGLTMLVQGLTETIRQERADPLPTQDHHESTAD